MKIANLFSKMKSAEKKDTGMELPRIILLGEKEKEEYLNKLTKALYSYPKEVYSAKELLSFRYFLTRNIEAFKSNFKLFTPLEVNAVSGLPTITMFSILEGIKDNFEECEKVLSTKLEKILEGELEKSKSLKSNDDLTNWIKRGMEWLSEKEDDKHSFVHYRDLISELLLNKILYFNKEIHKKLKNLEDYYSKELALLEEVKLYLSLWESEQELNKELGGGGSSKFLNDKDIDSFCLISNGIDLHFFVVYMVDFHNEPNKKSVKNLKRIVEKENIKYILPVLDVNGMFLFFKEFGLEPTMIEKHTIGPFYTSLVLPDSDPEIHELVKKKNAFVLNMKQSKFIRKDTNYTFKRFRTNDKIVYFNQEKNIKICDKSIAGEIKKMYPEDVVWEA